MGALGAAVRGGRGPGVVGVSGLVVVAVIETRSRGSWLLVLAVVLGLAMVLVAALAGPARAEGTGSPSPSASASAEPSASPSPLPTGGGDPPQDPGVLTVTMDGDQYAFLQGTAFVLIVVSLVGVIGAWGRRG